MYTLDWIERLKAAGRISLPEGARLRAVSPVVWGLGVTSLLTDVSSEMVSSVLPVYLVLHLHLSPLLFAAIDGLYNGLSVALVAILSGAFADRWSRHKEAALSGYALSAAGKLGLLLAGGAAGLITASVSVDRIGKGIRTAPRDSLISLHTPHHLLGTAFGVHRALDAAGALLGPLAAFVLLAQLPGAFDALWSVSFIVACLGVAALWLFVPRYRELAPAAEVSSPHRHVRFASRRFVELAVYGTVLALLTVSDGFIYLLLQQKSGIEPGFVPLFYVGTALAYVIFAIPAGQLADHYGRARVFVGGYVLLLTLYVVVYFGDDIGSSLVFASLLLLGLYYAATEGVLMALGSAALSREARTTGLAILATCVGIGKVVSSVGFGWIWQECGPDAGITVFATCGALALAVLAPRLRRLDHA